MTPIHSVYLDQAARAEADPRITVTQYSAAEVIRQFLAVYACLDFKPQLDDIGIGRYHFTRRKKALREFRALSIALWELALQKSFPQDAEGFFQEFRASLPLLFSDEKERNRVEQRIRSYKECLSVKKDTDFLPAAELLARALAFDPNKMQRLRLKISLITRTLYTMIFDKLV